VLVSGTHSIAVSPGRQARSANPSAKTSGTYFGMDPDGFRDISCREGSSGILEAFYLKTIYSNISALI